MIPAPPTKNIARLVGTGASGTLTVSDLASLIPAGSNHLIVRYYGQSDNASVSVNCQLRINNNSSGIYDQIGTYNDGSNNVFYNRAESELDIWQVPGTSTYAAHMGLGSFFIPGAFKTDIEKTVWAMSGFSERCGFMHGSYNVKIAVDRLDFILSAGNWTSDSVISIDVVDENFLIDEQDPPAGTASIPLPNFDGVYPYGDIHVLAALSASGTGTPNLSRDGDKLSVGQYVYIDSTLSSGAVLGGSLGTTQFGVGLSAATMAALGFWEFPGGARANRAQTRNWHQVNAYGRIRQGVDARIEWQMHADEDFNDAVAHLPIRDLQFDIDAGTFETIGGAWAYHGPKNVIYYKDFDKDDTAAPTSIDIDLTPDEFDKYDFLRITCMVRDTRAAQKNIWDVIFNDDTADANYRHTRTTMQAASTNEAPVASQGTGESLEESINGATATAGAGSEDILTPIILTLGGHSLSGTYKTMGGVYGGYGYSTSGNRDTVMEFRTWLNTAPITKITLQAANSANAIAGSTVQVEGITLKDQENDGVKGEVEVLVDWAGDEYGDAIDDITSDVLEWDSFVGADSVDLTGQTIVGQMTAELDNSAGKYNSFNTSSPLTGLILPNRRIRVRSIKPVVRDLWAGYLIRIQPSISSGQAQTATLEAAGAGQIFDSKIRVGMQTNIRTDEAFTEILDQLDWPAADRHIPVNGSITMTRWFADDDVLALGLMRDITNTERGRYTERPDGVMQFEARDYRATGKRLVEQANYSDDPSDSLGFHSIRQIDTLRNLYNEFRGAVRIFSVESIATLWTDPQANTTGDAISLAVGDSVTIWARFPNPDSDTKAQSVNAWTTPAATTDFRWFQNNNGTGTEITSSVAIAVVKYSNAMKITYTNNHGSLAGYLTSHKARGTQVSLSDPIMVVVEDATSIAAYGRRTYVQPTDPRWVPDTATLQTDLETLLAIYKDPIPMLELELTGQKNHVAMVDVLSRRVSDRVTVEADGSILNMGHVDRPFYIENVSHTWDRAHLLTTVLGLSDAAASGVWWRLGYSRLDYDTVPG